MRDKDKPTGFLKDFADFFEAFEQRLRDSGIPVTRAPRQTEGSSGTAPLKATFVPRKRAEAEPPEQ